MLTKYRTKMDRLHDYLCNDPNHPIIQIHHSYIDHQKLFRARLISWIYITVIYIWVLWEMGSITTNFIYLTLQGYFVTWLFYTAVLQDYWLTKIYGKQNHPCKKFKHYIEIIYEVALCFEVPITLVFWGLLFQILIRNGASLGEIILNTNLHLGPFLCLLVELYYNNFSFPKRHFWIAVFYGTGYLLINWGILFIYVAVYSLTVKVIYEPIDWKSILSFCIVFGCYVITFGTHHFGSFAYRKWKADELTSKITEGLIEEIQQKPISAESTLKTEKSSTNKNDFEITNRINEGRKNEKPTKESEVLL